MSKKREKDKDGKGEHMKKFTQKTEKERKHLKKKDKR